MFSEVIVRDGALIELTSADVGKYIRVVDPGNCRLRMTEFSPALGDEIHVEHVSLGRVDIDVLVGATIRIMPMFYPELLGIYGVVTFKCVGTNEWVCFGCLKPRADWQLDIDRGTGLNYELDYALDVDWEAEFLALEASIDAFKNGSP